MSVITFPFPSVRVMRQTWGQQRNDLYFRSAFGSQSVEISEPLWIATLEAPGQYENQAGAWQSVGLQLKGGKNQLALYNLARSIPVGTMRGDLTFNSNAGQGATVLSIIATAQPSEIGHTLVPGDFIGFGAGVTQQLVMVVIGGVADSNSIISVTVEPPLRTPFIAGDEVRWRMPTALFRRKIGSVFQWENVGATSEGYTLDLIEDWRT